MQLRSPSVCASLIPSSLLLHSLPSLMSSLVRSCLTGDVSLHLVAVSDLAGLSLDPISSGAVYGWAVKESESIAALS